MKNAKLRNLKANASAALATASTAIMMAPFVGVMASDINSSFDDILGGDAQKVSISWSEVNPSNVVNNTITLIAWILRIVGMFMVVKGFVDWLTAKQDENSVNESKATRLMALSFVFLIAPSVIQYILTGSLL